MKSEPERPLSPFQALAGTLGVQPYGKTRLNPAPHQKTPQAQASLRRKAAQAESLEEDAGMFLEPEALFGAARLDRGQASHRPHESFLKGKGRADLQVDLHGLRLEEAKARLEQTLSRCKASGARYLEIIHGKGGAQGSVLKGLCHEVLLRSSLVLVSRSVLERSGQSGAVRVVLRRDRT